MLVLTNSNQNAWQNNIYDEQQSVSTSIIYNIIIYYKLPLNDFLGLLGSEVYF